MPQCNACNGAHKGIAAAPAAEVGGEQVVEHVQLQLQWECHCP